MQIGGNARSFSLLFGGDPSLLRRLFRRRNFCRQALCLLRSCNTCLLLSLGLGGSACLLLFLFRFFPGDLLLLCLSLGRFGFLLLSCKFGSRFRVCRIKSN